MNVWTAIKVFFSGALKAVLAALIPWLKTEAARFISELLPDAKKIVAEVAVMDISNREKFELAAIRIKQIASDLGYEFKDRYVNQLVEIAYGLFKEESKD